MELLERRGRARKTGVWERRLSPLQTQLAPQQGRLHSKKPTRLRKTTSAEFASKFCPGNNYPPKLTTHQPLLLESTASKVLSPHSLVLPSPQPHSIKQGRHGLAFPDTEAEVEPSSEA